MKSKIQLLALIMVLNSCIEENANNYQEVRLNSFSIVIPENWKQLKVNGIDSSVDAFLTKKNDTILFDYGKYSSKIDNVVNVSDINEKRELDSLGFPTKEMFFSKIPDIDKNQGTFHREYFYYEEIDGKMAKIQVPKHIGQGFTKIYFDDINGKTLSIRSKNLDSTEQFELLKSFKTLKFQ